MYCKTMFNRKNFNKVVRDVTDTTRFGKPIAFDSNMKHCEMMSVFFFCFTCIFNASELYTPSAQVRDTLQLKGGRITHPTPPLTWCVFG
ncbi:unnamed protein product [Acanthoscelides obtectus]|uniref:Uncharacterized protein n=1 Tax=Acanthoscelides obtectus TaxID=200917 RepID=A0A9P0Q0E9_ACAOB|nr:unnamed protein product [Acanthoscelides obtectus]CAK1651509.1 hypothetical protein AOBTE_LOCUS17324 [Acanthoscelides obtectus]